MPAEPRAATEPPAPTPYDRWERTAWAGRGPAYADTYAVACGYAAGPLLDAAGVGPGTRVLDVGTGPGTVAALALERGARVTAVDAEPSMVELAAARVPGAEVRAAILPDLPFPAGAFDAVIANFLINHVGRPAAGVAELARVTRPGGRVALSVWPQPAGAMQQLWYDVLAAAGLTMPADIPTVAEAENFARTPDGFAALLRSAGLDRVDCRRLDWVLRVDPERWWRGSLHGFGALGRAMRPLPETARAAVKRHYDRLAAGHLAADGSLALPTSALVATGMVPAG
ncbi:class I SAM-dependent methyltransferase [Plantactinospora siamensis]|uniref:Class I SAM-dependent methyltransferase n=1 Tax=Plantactinospora siamensis TaxID=555372 RepID=A0ABV6NW73_9ACTN